MPREANARLTTLPHGVSNLLETYFGVSKENFHLWLLFHNSATKKNYTAFVESNKACSNETPRPFPPKELSKIEP